MITKVTLITVSVNGICHKNKYFMDIQSVDLQL